MVAWSPERIKRELDWSHYDDGRAKGHVAFVNPSDFLKATTKNKTTESQISSDAGDLDEQKLKETSQSPFLRVRNGKIFDHEGRHRMSALAAAGHTSVPVILWHDTAQKLQPVDETTLKAQHPNRPALNVTNAIPLHRDYQDQIEDAMSGSRLRFGDGGDVEGDGITAYHGSPHDFDQFDTSKIGTGEGNASYGHGLYFAEHEPVAKSYRNAMSPSYFLIDGKKINPLSGPESWAYNEINDKLKTESEDPFSDAKKSISNSSFLSPSDQNAALQAIDNWVKQNPKIVSTGHMYEVHINAHPDHFLDWDEVLEDQNPHIKTALQRVADHDEAEKGYTDLHEHLADPDAYTGGAFYRTLAERGRAKEASEILSQMGVKGIRYKDAGSRFSNEKPSYNYVVFDHNHVAVKRKYARGGMVDEAA
jgi:hypothetical protein